MAIKLIYKDEIPGVAEGATVAVSVETENFANPALLPFGAETGGIATLEPNGWGLTHDYKVKDKQNFGFWSSEISDNEGNFTNPPVITITLDAQYLVTGFSLWFSPDTGDYCSKINTVLYQGETAVYSADFSINSTTYDMEIKGGIVFDKMVVTLSKTNNPKRRAKLELLKIGITRLIAGKDIVSVNSLSEIDPISDSIPSNTLDATFRMAKSTDVFFQKKQTVELYDNNELIGVFYIEEGRQDGETTYSLSANDVIGALDSRNYKPSYGNTNTESYGDGIWTVKTPVGNIVAEILGDEFPFELSPDLVGQTMSGYLPRESKKDAIKRVAFALGACVDTSGVRGVKIFKPQRGTDIPAHEVFNDGNIEVSELITEVTLKVYDVYMNEGYKKDKELSFESETGAYMAYNYYEATAQNPNVPAGAYGNQIQYDECYMISSKEQTQELTDNILSHYMRRKKYTFRHVDKGQRVGDYVSTVLPWGEPVSGIIVRKKLTYSGITVSETTMLLDE